MTTGDPLVVRGAMKPLPTLTKPLRRVDLATKEPAQALRERTDSCTVPAAGVVGGGDGGARAGRGLPREVRRRPHRRRPRRAAAPTRSGSGGGARRRHSTAALVLVGFMGAGKSTGARALAAELGASAARLRPRARARAGRADRGVLRPRGRGRLPRARGGDGAASCWPAATLAVIALGGGAVQLRARARGARRGTPWCTSRSTPTTPGAARRARAGRWPATGPASTQLHGDRVRALRVGGRRRAAARRPRRAAPRAALPAALRRGAAGHAAGVGGGGVRRLPGVLRPRADRVRLLPAAGRAGASW